MRHLINRKSAGRMLAAAVLLTAAAACGDDEESSEPTASDQSSVSSDEAATASTAASAPSSDSSGEAQVDTTTGRAIEEGQVVVYSVNSPAVNDAVAAAFEEQYPGLSAEIVRLTTAELAQRVDAEREGGTSGADVVVHTDRGWFEERGASGALATLSSPAVGALDDSLLVSGGTSVVTGLGVFGFGWNTQTVDGELSFEDLVDDRFRGRIGTYDIVMQPTFLMYYNWIEEQYGREFLERLAGAEPRFYESGGPMAQSMAAGEIDVVTVLTASSIPEGSPIAIAYPERPAATPFIAGALANAEHPNAASLFVDFLVSPVGQEIWTAGQASVLPTTQSSAFTFDQVVPLNAAAQADGFFDTYLAALEDVFGR